MGHTIEFVSRILGTQSNFVEFRDSRDLHVLMILLCVIACLNNMHIL